MFKSRQRRMRLDLSVRLRGTSKKKESDVNTPQNPTTRLAALERIAEAARQLMTHLRYCTVAESGERAGPGNYLRDALDELGERT